MKCDGIFLLDSDGCDVSARCPSIRWPADYILVERRGVDWARARGLLLPAAVSPLLLGCCSPLEASALDTVMALSPASRLVMILIGVNAVDISS